MVKIRSRKKTSSRIRQGRKEEVRWKWRGTKKEKRCLCPFCSAVCVVEGNEQACAVNDNKWLKKLSVAIILASH
jgi:hypothetical protein